MIVADTGAVVALIDADDRHHNAMRFVFEADPAAWVLPWAVLPEVDYLLLTHVGSKTAVLLMADLAAGLYAIEWGAASDIERASELCERYAGLRLGLVDSVVMATAERLDARAIATLDLRHFGAVTIEGQPSLLPRDI